MSNTSLLRTSLFEKMNDAQKEAADYFIKLEPGPKMIAYQGFIEGLISPPPETLPRQLRQNWNIAHMGLGLAGELLEFQHELTFSSKVKELGDIFWYLCNLASMMNIRVSLIISDIDYRIDQDNFEISDHLFVDLEKVVDQCKRVVFYQKEQELDTLHNAVQDALVRFCTELHFLCIAEINFMKLSIRYTLGTFSSAEADLKRA
jgi:NTP pyrophosphatase (non-canonical NTP hydrolase)